MISKRTLTEGSGTRVHRDCDSFTAGNQRFVIEAVCRDASFAFRLGLGDVSFEPNGADVSSRGKSRRVVLARVASCRFVSTTPPFSFFLTSLFQFLLTRSSSPVKSFPSIKFAVPKRYRSTFDTIRTFTATSLSFATFEPTKPNPRAHRFGRIDSSRLDSTRSVRPLYSPFQCAVTLETS